MSTPCSKQTFLSDPLQTTTIAAAADAAVTAAGATPVLFILLFCR
jgi:hypothetical protein